MRTIIIGLMGSFLFATLFADTLFADTLVVPFPSDAKIQNNILVPDGGNNPWYSKSGGKNIRTYTIDRSGSGNMRKIYTFHMSKYSHESTGLVSKDLPVIAKQSYGFSGSIRANTPTTLRIRYISQGGQYTYSEPLTIPVSTRWSRISFSVSPPDSTISMSILYEMSSMGNIQASNFFFTPHNNIPTPLLPIVRLIGGYHGGGGGGTSQNTANTTNIPTTGIGTTNIGTGTTGTGTTGTGTTGTGTTGTGSTGTGTTGTGTTGTGTTGTGTTGTTGTGMTGTGTPPYVCSINMIRNPCLENSTILTGVPDGWLTGSYGTNMATFGYPVIGAHGSGAMIDMATYIDGDAKWYFTDVPVRPYASYQYSVKYTSTVPAKLTLRYTRGSGSYIYTEIAQLSPSTTWTGASVHFTIPADVVTLTVFHQLAATGSLVIDEASLVPLVDAFSGTPFASGMTTFSFDDGWRSQMINAVGVLDNSHIHGTFGIVTNEMQNADLHASGSNIYMNTAETLALQSNGHEIADHTLSHTNLTTLSLSGVIDDVVQSRNALLTAGFAPVTSFIYPFGGHSTPIDQIIRDSGFTAGRSDQSGYNTQDTDKQSLYIQVMTANTTLGQVQHWVDTAYENHLWLILMFHQIDTTGTAFSVDPTLFAHIVDYVRNKGIATVTMSEGVTHMH